MPEEMSETSVPEEAPEGFEPEVPDETTLQGEVDGTEGEESGEAESSEPDDPFAAYGGKDTIEQAVEIHKALQTDDGVWNMFFQAGRSLGLGVREIESLFNQGQVAEEESGPGLADDDVMTYGQFKELLNQQVLTPMQQQNQQTQEAAARSAIDTTMMELGVKDNNVRDAVLDLGNRYLGDDISPKAVSEAVRKGFDAYKALVQQERAAAVAAKRESAASVPKSPAGGTVSSQAATGEEPKDVASAIRRARERIRQSA